MNYEGERFLLKLYRDLYNSDEVKFADFRSGKNSRDKYESIKTPSPLISHSFFEGRKNVSYML